MYIYITVMQKTAILPQCRQSCSTPVRSIHCLSRKLAMLIVKSYISYNALPAPFLVSRGQTLELQLLCKLFPRL